MYMDEVHQKLAEGWDIGEIAMGKDWQAKYPYIARWGHLHSLSSSGNSHEMNLEVRCGLGHLSFQSITYIVCRKQFESPREDAYQVVDDVIKQWLKENEGEDSRMKARWEDTTTWHAQQPHLAQWIERGKRCCVEIKIDRVAGTGHAKVWHYDKPTNTETILFQTQNETVSEADLLHAINESIAKWSVENPNFEYSI